MWIAHVLHANETNRKGQIMEGEKCICCRWRWHEVAKKWWWLLRWWLFFVFLVQRLKPLFSFIFSCFDCASPSLFLFCSPCPYVFSLSGLFCLCFSSCPLLYSVFLFLSFTVMKGWKKTPLCSPLICVILSYLFLFFFVFLLSPFFFSFLSPVLRSVKEAYI
jgi:hypothetical protein